MSNKYTIAGGKVFDQSGSVVERLDRSGKIVMYSQSTSDSIDQVESKVPVFAKTNSIITGLEFNGAVFDTVFLGGSTANNSIRIQACIDYISASGGGVVAQDGVAYPIGDIPIQLKSGVTLRGVSGKTSVTSGQLVNLVQVLPGKNMAIVGVEFVSTKIDAAENFYGLVYSANSSISDFALVDCGFIASASNVNGFKCVAEESDCIVKDVTITRCKFKSLGRMGVEFQNHNGSTIADRYLNVRIKHCVFDDVGRIGNGMGVSLSGRGTGCEVVSNVFNNCPQVGIELIGAQHTRCSRNVFSGTIGRIIQTANETPMLGITISDNKTNGRVTGSAMYLASLVNPLVFGNKFLATNSCEIKSLGTKFTSNEIDTTDVYAVIVDNASNCTITDNTLRTDSGVSNYAVLRLYGSGTTRTLVTGNRLHKGPGGGFIDQQSGASGNLIERNFASDDNLYLTS